MSKGVSKETGMGRIVTQVKLASLVDPDKSLAVSALVDTGAAYITLPNAWRDRLGEMEQLAEIELDLGDQSVRKGAVCGPLRAQIAGFRPMMAEVLFVDMQPDEDGDYGPLVGYIALEQAGAAVDMLGHRLVRGKRGDLK